MSFKAFPEKWTVLLFCYIKSNGKQKLHLELISDENVFFKWSSAEMASDIMEMLVSEAISAWDHSENILESMVGSRGSSLV